MRNYLGNKKNKELYNAQIADDNNIIMFCQHILLDSFRSQRLKVYMDVSADWTDFDSWHYCDWGVK